MQNAKLKMQNGRLKSAPFVFHFAFYIFNFSFRYCGQWRWQCYSAEAVNAAQVIFSPRLIDNAFVT